MIKKNVGFLKATTVCYLCAKIFLCDYEKSSIFAG